MKIRKTKTNVLLPLLLVASLFVVGAAVEMVIAEPRSGGYPSNYIDSGLQLAEPRNGGYPSSITGNAELLSITGA